MKRVLFIISSFLLCVSFYNCSSDVEELNPDDLVGASTTNNPDQNNETSNANEATNDNEVPTSGETTENNNPTPPTPVVTIPETEFPVTLSLNGLPTNFVDPTASNRAQNINFGTQGVVSFTVLDNANPSNANFNFTIIFSRNDLSIGRKILSTSAATGNSSLQLVDLNRLGEGITFSVRSGSSIDIQSIDPVNGIVQGVFNASFTENTPLLGPTNVFLVENGTFRFTYDVE